MSCVKVSSTYKLCFPNSCSNIYCWMRYTSIDIHIIKIRWSHNHLIFIIGILISFLKDENLLWTTNSFLSIRIFFMSTVLTHWGWVMQICISKLTIIGSDIGFPPGRGQAIISINTGILLIWTLETNLSQILSNIHSFSLKKCIWRCCLQNGSNFVEPWWLSW